MFAVETRKPIQLSGSPSYLPNNLTSSPNGLTSYVRINEVYLVKTNGESTRLPVARCRIYQAKFVQVQRRTVLAITSDLGVQVWSADGDTMLFYYALSSLLGTLQEEGRYMRGVTGQDNFLCVGCSTGTITVFDCSGDLTRGNYPLLHSLDTLGQSLYALSSSPSLLTAGDDYGNILAYRIESAFERAFTIRGSGQPCTCLFNTEFVVFAGYSTGHIRVYRTDTTELAIEIAAHVRLVTGLSYNEELQLAASCSPDQMMHVWSVPNFRSKANSSLDCVFSQQLDNKMCTGVSFVGDHKMAVAVYDDEELVVLNRA